VKIIEYSNHVKQEYHCNPVRPAGTGLDSIEYMSDGMPGARRSRREQRRRRKARRRRVVWTVTGVVLLAAVATAYAATSHRGGGAVARRERPAVRASAKPVPMDLGPGLVDVSNGLSGHLSVAMLDTASGKWATYGDGRFDTASIVKVDILATLLLQAQDARRNLSAQERTYAKDMIENSDNDATSALWTVIGRRCGV
jgi:beta-lactamase class A